MGVVNGMRPDQTVDKASFQSAEVWPSTNYALAACFVQEGMVKEGFELAMSVYNSVYRNFGYWFQTPKAWDFYGRFRAISSMGPLSIWAIQWAWETSTNQKTLPKNDIVFK